MAVGSIEEEYERISSSGWGPEFDRIVETCKRYEYTALEARKPHNVIYNRYMDICPYDHSRVILKKSTGDYINANIVRVERADKRYILTQGPTSASTPHFWRMIWEHDCEAIVMLNKRIENDRVKCNLYWPGAVGPEHTMTLQSVGLRVEQLTDDCHGYYFTRKIRVTDLDTDASREVVQFHYTTWPDFGVPSSPTAFLNFLYAVRASGAMDESVGPPVVHCSAGVGRSGTFCLVDSCLTLIEKFGADSVNVREILLEMRRYRMGLIQTPDQLRFSYQAIIKGARDRLEGNVTVQNGDEDLYDVPKEDTNEAPPVPPPRAASLKTNSNSNGGGSDDSDSDDAGIPNGDNDDDLPMRDLPEVPSDSEDDGDDEKELEDDQLSNDNNQIGTEVLNDNHVKTQENAEKDGLRRRQLLSEKSAKLQEKVQEMKRKQQKAEEWQKKKRSFYIPMIIGLGVAIFAISYLSLKN